MIPISFSSFQEKISSLIEKSAINSWNWIYWVFFFGIIPAIIVTIPIIIHSIPPASRTPPLDFVNQTFILNSNFPSLLSMFFANYSHIEITHLCSNLLMYFIVISIIFLLEKNKQVFIISSTFFFVVFPYLNSISSIVFFQNTQIINPTFIGFSGCILFT